MAEHAANSLRPGERIVACCHLESYPGRALPDGTKEVRVRLVAEELAVSLRFADVEPD
jgi:hypothetical protein